MTDVMGLRERKRSETRAGLERAAVDLVLRDGLDGTTVDAICAIVEVSPRTFFNYFDSKEDAILGLNDSGFNETTADDFVAAADRGLASGNALAESVVALLLAIMAPSPSGSALQKRRFQVVRRYPELLSRHVSQLINMSENLISAITMLMARDPRFAANDNGSGVDSPVTGSTATATENRAMAELLLALAGGALRVSVREWVHAGGGDQTGMESRAIELVRKVTEKL
jgi:AcrR family transcriptional regulator